MRALTVLALSYALLACGCATAPSLKPVPAGEAVSISLVASSKYPLVVDFRNTALGDGMSAGLGSGIVVGGLWGLSCGPFAVLCVPLGAVTGMVTGGAAGAAVGATGALSREKSDQVRDRLVRLEQAHPVLAELQRHLGDRAQKYWPVTWNSATPLITAELQTLEVATTRDERVRFVLRVTVRQRQIPVDREAKTLQKTYEYAGPLTGLAVWLDEQSDFLDTSFAIACQQISTQIVADLAVR